jgi:hypothetical protein
MRLLTVLGLCAASAAAAQVDVLYYSPDITVTLGTLTAGDECVVVDTLTSLAFVALPGLPPKADLTAFERLAGGDLLFALDVTVVLGGSTATPQDLILYDGSSFSLELDGSAIGVPDRMQIDAIAMVGADLLLSWDVSESLGGLQVDDEDLVRLAGGTLSLFFDGSAAGIDQALDLDAAHRRADGRLLLSFDGSGATEVPFDDEDVLEYDPATGSWSLAFDASLADGDWTAADLDALSLAPGLIFADGFESGGDDGVVADDRRLSRARDHGGGAAA